MIIFVGRLNHLASDHFLLFDVIGMQGGSLSNFYLIYTFPIFHFSLIH